MGKLLIIAEKPSVATDLARVLAKLPSLGKFEKQGKDRNIYFENEAAVITSAVGHLVELKMPTGPNGKNLPWKFDVLPAIPPQFELQPIEQSETRLKQVLKLARRKDIDQIVNACDAGREGELIFAYIMELGKIEKPVQRLWMQSMTDGSIIEAWDKLRPSAEMSDLTDAAKCRSESDWLIGLNSTRALTCFRSRHGGFNITAAGRVQTPTLAILAKREKEIREFLPTSYSEVHATFSVSAGEYLGKWIDPNFKKSTDLPHGRAERIWERTSSEEIHARCEGKTALITEEKKPQKQAPAQLYDLTSLQREASSRFGYSAKRTLQIAQALYERYKMLTYPRTDSKCLPEDYLGKVHETVDAIQSDYSPLAPFAKEVKQNEWVKPNKRIFNNAKVSDHFAIIPTGRFVKLDEDAQKIFDLVTKRFLAIFYPSAVYEVTRRYSVIDHGNQKDTFRTDGRVLVEPGWLAVYGRKPGVPEGKDELTGVTEGESGQVTDIEIKDDETRPPARYSEATLLSAMESAGKLITEEELREAMGERGLGTPATRAATIEGLLRQKYLARDGREFHVSGKGMRLIEILHEMDIDTLASASMTGEWEFKLRQMEEGHIARSDFMKEIIDLTRNIVERAKEHSDMLKNRVFPDLPCPCPACGTENLKQTDATFECRNEECKFKGKKHIAGRELTEEESIQLYSTKFVGPLEGFRSRFNKPFEAALELDAKFKVNFVFDQDEPESIQDFKEEQIIGHTKLPDGREVTVYETEKAYFVPALANEDNKNGLRLGKMILQRTIPADQALKLVGEGKTDLLNGFISKRTKRAFGAHLTLNLEEYKIGFEFAERKTAAKKGAKKKTATKKKTAKKAAKKKTASKKEESS